MYRKSYTGFIIWMILFFALCLGIPFVFPGFDETSYTRVLMNLCTIGMAILTFMIWRNEYVYWYTGVSYEEAEKAGSERRREYAFRHFRLFGGYALVALGYTMASILTGLPWWVDMTIIGVGLIAAAFRTMKYKL